MTDERKQHHLCASAEVQKASWPQGATAGLLLVAALCLGIATALYQVAGPRDIFAESPR